MGRPLRAAAGGYVYHVLNRANARLRIFRKEGDYEAFEQVLTDALTHVPGMRLLSYCLMPNHWHLLVWPRGDGELSDFAHYLSLTHTQRWHAHHRHAGTGHLYQGRFKSFPVARDDHFLKVCRYVERNALRADLVERAEDWRWGSLWRRRQKDPELSRILSPWPVPEPRQWLQIVNRPQREADLEQVRLSVQRGRPYGGEAWMATVASRLGLESTLRPRGRPRIREDDDKGS